LEETDIAFICRNHIRFAVTIEITDNHIAWSRAHGFESDRRRESGSGSEQQAEHVRR
jgi:hypothetical protein